MRLKYLFTAFLALLLFLSNSMSATACCEGKCNTSEECEYENCFESSNWFSCPTGRKIIITCTEGSGGTYDPDWPYDWSPGGSPDTICDKTCGTVGSGNGSAGCVIETKNIWCGACDDPTPTPNPTTGGGGGNPTATPTPGTVLISGSIQQDLGAAFSGNFCSQTTTSPLTVPGIDLYAHNVANYHPSTFNNNNFTINTSYTGNNYTVVLDLSAQTGAVNYVCSCPAAHDPNNPYLCSYSGVGSPGSNVNFYLDEYNLSSKSWFQVFGGNIFSDTQISSSVPYNFCSIDENCQAAIFVPKTTSSSPLSSGFPIISSANSSDLQSNISEMVYHSYLHLGDRTNNVNSYGVATDLAQLSYDYFYKLVENSTQKVGNGEDLEPLLADWTNSSWWSSSDVNFIKVDGNVSIDETQGFNLSSGQKLVVFVDGNLTLDDSNPNDSNRKIISVADGGFLAFFASKNVLITPNVGYELDPLIPSTPIVSNANSNLEGVFVADGNLIVQTKSAIGEVPPDRKFIGSGTFVGWNNVLLNRTFEDGSFGPILNNSQAIENFIYRPDLLANWPVKLKASVSNWREVDPQLINQ